MRKSHMRGPNKAIQQLWHIMPTMEDVVSDLCGATMFSKLDSKQGYHQLVLNPESRHVTTFSTHIGLRRYKHLNFGISEIFQNEICIVLDGMEGALSVCDDFLMYGENDAEHEE